MDQILFLFMCFMCALSTNPDYKRAKECYVSVGYNIDYQGSRNRSGTGASCVQWRDTTWDNRDFDGSMQNNFCRNPDKDIRGPWCIVKNGDKELCTVPKCASSAMFDGTGNIDHGIIEGNATTKDEIYFSFYTNDGWQNDATMLTVVSWGAGFLNIMINSNYESEIKDVIKLEWKFSRNRLPISLTSRPGVAATGKVVRVRIIRDSRQLKMLVNEEEYTATITEDTSPDAIFDSPENIFIGRSPYGRNGFKGCISDVSFNGIRTLDMAMGSRPKPEEETIIISRGVWEGCLLVPPSDWSQPPLPPTDPSNEVERDEEIFAENAKLSGNGTSYESSSERHSLPAILLALITSILLLQNG